MIGLASTHPAMAAATLASASTTAAPVTGAREDGYAEPRSDELKHARDSTDHPGEDDADDDEEAPEGSGSDLAAVVASLEAQWVRKKAQWLAHFRNNSNSSTNGAPTEPEPTPSPTPERDADSTCHVCNVSLRLYRLRHRCRNCERAVCGVHSKNQLPLPHRGIRKEVRVCDICVRQLVQRRAGYRSPRPSSSRRGRTLTTTDESGYQLSETAMTPPPSPSASPDDGSLTPRPSLSLPNTPMNGEMAAAAASSAQLLDAASGVLYSCLVEEQANIVDELLYLGTLTMGGRSLASRHMNVAIWKDRWFMLTSAELLCFKAVDDERPVAALGELRSSVHLTDILHVEVTEQYPRILTVIRSDGRVFRIRAKTPEQCQEIATALRRAQQLFQDAMHRLQRGEQPEDFAISCVTLQHESSLPEHVLASAPTLDHALRVEMYPSSILRFYVHGPEVTGVAQASCQMLLSALQRHRTIDIVADPLRPQEPKLLRVELCPAPVSSTEIQAKETRTRTFWGVTSGLIALGAYVHQSQWTALEVFVWLVVLVLALTRFHDPLMLLLTTRRIHQAKRFGVTCVRISSATRQGDDEDEHAVVRKDEPVNLRFLEGCNGDVEEARTRYRETMAWRKAEGIDFILTRPLPQFADMKASYTHGTHKKDKHGHLVSFEHFGYMKKMRDEFISRGVTEAEALRYHCFLQEYLWQVIDPRDFPDGNQLKVFDIKGISMSDVSGDVFTYMKNLGMTIAQYNPERIYQVFIVNPPSWFNLIWKLVSPSINPKTRERVHVLRGQKEIAKALLEFVAEEDLPVEYGGTCCCPGGCLTNSPEERDLRDYVENYLNVMEEGDPRIAVALDELKQKYAKQLQPHMKITGMSDGTATEHDTRTS